MTRPGALFHRPVQPVDPSGAKLQIAPVAQILKLLANLRTDVPVCLDKHGSRPQRRLLGNYAYQDYRHSGDATTLA
jgi:hypothetical protein